MNALARCFIVCLPVLAFLAGGCATYGLWHDECLEAVNAPANTTNLTFLHDPKRLDFLVVYDETCDRNDRVRPRAYWLKSYNDLPDVTHHRPHFAKYKAIPDLPRVPVLCGAPTQTNGYPAGYCVVMETNGASFKLFHDGRLVEAHELPIYIDGKGKAAKIALTPLAVTADITIFGGVCAYLWAEASAENGYFYYR